MKTNVNPQENPFYERGAECINPQENPESPNNKRELADSLADDLGYSRRFLLKLPKDVLIEFYKIQMECGGGLRLQLAVNSYLLLLYKLVTV